MEGNSEDQHEGASAEPSSTPTAYSPEREQRKLRHAVELEVSLLRSRIRFNKRLLAAFCVLFSGLATTDVAGEQGTTLCMTISTICLGHFAFDLWVDVPEASTFLKRHAHHETLAILSTLIAFLVCSRFQSVFWRALCLIAMPVTLTREVQPFRPYLAFVILHFSASVFVLRKELWGEGGQWLVNVVIVDTFLLTSAKEKDAAAHVRKVLASTLAFLTNMLTTMCDGYLLESGHGHIVGVDRRAMQLFGVDAQTFESQQLDFYQQLGAPECCRKVSNGLSTMDLHNIDGSASFEAEVYTCEWDLQEGSLPLVLAGGVKADGLSGRLHFRGIRVLRQLFEDRPQPEGGREALEPADTVRDVMNEVAEDDLQEMREPADEEPEVETVAAATGLRAVEAVRWPQSDVMSVASADLASTPPSEVTFAGCLGALGVLGLGVGDYRRITLVGRGAHGGVWHVTDVNGKDFALKEVRLLGTVWQRDYPRNLRSIDREVRCLKRLSWASSVLVKIEDCWIHPRDSTACIVMELLPHTLRSVLDALRADKLEPPAEQTCAWLSQIAAGLAVIHAAGLMHRDIKPSNLLLTEDLSRCKVGDLGSCRQVQGVPADADARSEAASSADGGSALAGHTERVGTPGYISPEALNRRPYGCATDVYSLGCVLFELLTFSKLKDTPKFWEALGSTAALGLSFCGELGPLCLGMLEEEPTGRPTAAGIATHAVLRPHVDVLYEELPALSNILRS